MRLHRWTIIALLAALVLVPYWNAAEAASLFEQLQSSVLMKDLQQAQVNLANGVTNGDLAPDDPAATCLTSVVGSLAVKPNAAPYGINGLVSLGSVLYIDAHKLGRAKAAADQGCRAIIGQFVIDGIRQVSPLKLPN